MSFVGLIAGLNVNQRYTEICRLLNKSCTAPFTRGYFKSPIIEHYPEESGETKLSNCVFHIGTGYCSGGKAYGE